MRRLFTTPQRDATNEFDQYRTRLMARLFIMCIFLVQSIERIYFVIAESALSRTAFYLYILTFPLLACLSLIVYIEYWLSKKLGQRILKYTDIVDAIILILFIAEWVATLQSGFNRIRPDGPYLSISTVFSFTSFSWRTLIQNLIVRRWQFKIIAPLAAYSMSLGITVYNNPDSASFDLLRGLSQMAYTVGIFYFVDKMNVKLLLASLQQEKWVEINQFIINSIPEKIAILDADNKVKFLSKYLKAFMQKYDESLDANKFFKEIKHLQRQSDSESSVFSSAKKGDISYDPSLYKFDDLDSLDDLISNFKGMIRQENLDERHFLVFTGRLKSKTKEKEKSIEIKISFLQNDSKQYILIILEDTTKRDRIVALKSNNEYKDKLLASVSHELRAPLNGTINLIEAATKMPKTPHDINENFLKPAVRSARFLLHLINDILDMSQIRAKKLRLAYQSSNLKETLYETVQLLSLQAKKKGVSLEAIFDPHLPTNFYTDHTRLSQIVLNILSNAVKFTQEGSIKLTAVPIQGVSWVQISVKDTGIGMTRQDVKKLFQAFTRIETKNRENINPTGVGLGLNIAYELAEMLGPPEQGGITVHSELGKGSTFTFIIEDKATKSKLIKMQDTSITSEQLEIGIEPQLSLEHMERLTMQLIKRPTLRTSSLVSNVCECAEILVVDDDAFNIIAYDSVLGLLNVKHDNVYSGKNAIKKLVERSENPCSAHCRFYKVIFMDQEMPEINGSETAQEIRKLQRQNLLPNLSIIGCTGHEERREIEHFIESGANECIKKPISWAVLKEILEKYGCLQG